MSDSVPILRQPKKMYVGQLQLIAGIKKKSTFDFKFFCFAQLFFNSSTGMRRSRMPGAPQRPIFFVFVVHFVSFCTVFVEQMVLGVLG